MTLDEICAGIDEWATPAKLRFVLVLWLDGKPDDPKSIAVNANPRDQAAVPVALQTALNTLAESALHPTGRKT